VRKTSHDILEVTQALEEVLHHSLSGLDLDGDRVLSNHVDQIDLMTGTVTIEVTTGYCRNTCRRWRVISLSIITCPRGERS
jgi:hypothetical protein